MYTLDQALQHWQEKWWISPSRPTYRMLNQEISETLFRSRVLELRTALFHNLGNAPKRFSAGLVDVSGFTADGRICFYSYCPSFLTPEDSNFPARLDLYQKGKPYFLQITGNAELHPENGMRTRKLVYDSHYRLHVNMQRVLVKMQVDAVFYEDWSENPEGLFDRMRSVLYTWF